MNSIEALNPATVDPEYDNIYETRVKDLKKTSQSLWI